MRRIPVRPFVCLFLFIAVVLGAATAAERPNIVLIFVDDLGYGDLGCYGGETIRTPQIDALASRGQRWTNFYASGSVCVPSRRGLMTGRHPAFLNDVPLASIREKMLPAFLKRQGYATAILGKWHLAGYPDDFTQSPMHPLECGFDYHFGTPGSNDVPAPKGKKQTRDVFDAADKFTFKIPLIRGRELVEFPADQELFTQRYTREAVDWIRHHRDERFFLFLSHNMPHVPVFASEAFQGKSGAGVYGDVVEEIDWSVGRVVEALRENGIENDTLIIFTSDNGPWEMFGPHGGSAGPLRGEKGTPWEGGNRVPAIFYWPGVIEPGVVDGIGANLDLYASFAALIGGGEPEGDRGYISQDLSPVWLEGRTSPRDIWYFSGSGEAYRSGDYKIVLRSKDRGSNPDTRGREPIATHDPPLLFNLARDIGESVNIGSSHPEIVDRLQRELTAFRPRK